jgi:RND family efflux transporter MFP subunit
LLPANGTVAAWQEAVIGPEIANFRLTEVLVNVGDSVRKGQLLARIYGDTVAAELAQARAAAVEAEAMLAEAKANADRARRLQSSGAMSAQQINQLLTAEQTAAARLNAAKARIEADGLRLAQTRVLAPDDGIISARAATVGSLAQPGQELFRLIRGGRLEWRAEVTAAELAKITPGTPASLITPNGERVRGRVRTVAPTVDPQTRNGIVYVDLPALASAGGVRAGMFARGEFELGRAPALTLPQSAVLLREGFAYVFRVEPDSRVAQTKVSVGRRSGDRIEIVEGIGLDARVVAGGVGFLGDGDTVRVVDMPAADRTAAN